MRQVTTYVYRTTSKEAAIDTVHHHFLLRPHLNRHFRVPVQAGHTPAVSSPVLDSEPVPRPPSPAPCHALLSIIPAVSTQERPFIIAPVDEVDGVMLRGQCWGRQDDVMRTLRRVGWGGESDGNMRMRRSTRG